MKSNDESIFDVPEYAAAVKKENDVRDAAFLDLPADICGVKIRQMTAWHWVVLAGIDSPFLRSGVFMPEPEQVLMFLWVMSPMFERLSKAVLQNTAVGRWRQRRFIRRYKHLDYKRCVDGICAFVKDTFQDCPEGGEENDKRKAPNISFAAGVVHAIACEYGWNERDIVQMPLKRVFQYLNMIDALNRARNGEEPSWVNPSDSVKYKIIREERARRQQAKLNPEQKN